MHHGGALPVAEGILDAFCRRGHPTQALWGGSAAGTGGQAPDIAGGSGAGPGGKTACPGGPAGGSVVLSPLCAYD